MTFFDVKNLTVKFGGLTAVDNVSFDLNEGEVFTIIGPNGAGKTTLFNLISRLYTPSAGQIVFRDEDVTRLSAQEIAGRGIARTFQNIELFESASTLQNLLVGRHRHSTTRAWQDILRTRKVRDEEIAHRRAAEEVMDVLRLQRYRDITIGALPYGVRKVIEVARALCVGPTLLLLDEPSSGLNVEETNAMAEWILEINRRLRVTVLMVEHDMSLVSRVSDRVLALNYGKTMALGTAAEVQGHPDVVAAYLGGMMMGAQPILRLANVESTYGPITAIRGISLDLMQGQIVTVLGANGAGKTSILKTISGVLDPVKGIVEFEGRKIGSMEPDKVVRLGISHVPEGREVFPFLTVRDNLRMGAYIRSDSKAIADDLEKVFDYFPVLRERQNQIAGQLSGGQQQMLAISRALMSRPKVLLLDEPSLGLSPLLVKEIFAIIRRLNAEEGVSILLVEQNAKMALETAHYGYVLEVGRVVMHDTCANLLQSDQVREFYLGMHSEG